MECVFMHTSMGGRHLWGNSVHLTPRNACGTLSLLKVPACETSILLQELIGVSSCLEHRSCYKMYKKRRERSQRGGFAPISLSSPTPERLLIGRAGTTFAGSTQVPAVIVALGFTACLLSISPRTNCTNVHTRVKLNSRLLLVAPSYVRSALQVRAVFWPILEALMLDKGQLVIAPGTHQAAYLACLMAVLDHQLRDGLMAPPPALARLSMTHCTSSILSGDQGAIDTLVGSPSEPMLRKGIVLFGHCASLFVAHDNSCSGIRTRHTSPVSAKLPG